MGNLCSVKGAIDHWIYVQTGDRKNSGSDANIKVILYDDRGQKSPEIALDCQFRNDFERGQTDTFQCPPLDNLGDLVQIELWRDNEGVSPNWFCNVIVVNDTRTERTFYFPVQKWVKPGYHYMIPQYDTSVPSKDNFTEQRQNLLEEKRKVYQYAQLAHGLPAQIHKLPDDENFSDEYKNLFTPHWDLETQKIKLLAVSVVTKLTTDPWQGLDDITNVFSRGDAFPEPKCLKDWSHDSFFGAQRIVGCNPTQVKLCTALPENMGVTAEMLRPFLEGWTVKQIIEAKRLFIVDHKILEDLPTKDGRPMPAPMALFFLNGEKQLIPIAIQLFQDIAPDNPVFLCNDAPFTWIMAKMWFNLADASVHQSLTHLGYTHLMMESVCVSMHRCLPQNHPVFRLLAPHFVFLLAINTRGLNFLISPGGWVDKTMYIGTTGMFELIRRGMKEWRLDVQGNIQRDLERRGILDPKVLPCYPYRDDGITLQKAIETYVNKIIRLYYPNSEAVKADTDLQTWAAEMAGAIDQGGAGVHGVPGNGRFHHLDDLLSTCINLIFICSAGHAVANFGQYDDYGFPPNYPALLNGDPPTDKLPKSEEDLVRALPNKATTLDTMVVTRLLSGRGASSLGEFEVQYQYEPAACKAEQEFREELAKVSKIVQERNQYRPDLYKYTSLDPELVPNSISI